MKISILILLSSITLNVNAAKLPDGFGRSVVGGREIITKPSVKAESAEISKNLYKDDSGFDSFTGQYINNDGQVESADDPRVKIFDEEAIMTTGADSSKFLGDGRFEIKGFGKTCILEEVGFKKHPRDSQLFILDDETFEEIEACFNRKF